MNNYTSKEKQILLWTKCNQGYLGRLYKELLNNKRLLEYFVQMDFKDELEYMKYLDN